jgi:CheY-like chemotaxis protein
VVENDAFTRKRETDWLQARGCLAIGAANGAEAIRHFLDDPPDLVLMDCQVPELDGYRAARELRRIETGRASSRRTPVIGVSPLATEQERQKGRKAGMDDVLGRPLEEDALVALLERWLDETR